ncbi:MAG: SprT family zinc-dependent metalloprotease [Methanolobus sp.]|uniref:M48 family metallopeptidase n=1 Tax=Methanolobus sp. TaxID=1874737 RepID=UPI0027321B86|nr:SprT family zinc-dependent metalloprotease [Methanolobus sp.]MDP2215812.1 SprT family zinc-dependent metalloprotease [Methanolobus sp.]
MTGVTNCENRSFTYGQKTIEYRLIYAKRKTLEIAVHPDSTVIIKAPTGSEISLIEKKIHKRARWILKQVDYFRQFTPKTPERLYISGETHLYLGKQYRLKVTRGQKNSARLSGGVFQVTCLDEPEPELVKKLMKKWYSEKANIQFAESIERCWPKFKFLDFGKPSISVKCMQKRWGSLSEKGTMTLNTELVKAPKQCIDYVVIHELCHLKYHDHSPDYYRMLDSLMPGWEKIKHKLELSMA